MERTMELTAVVADDSRTLRRIVSSVLGRQGWRVVEAEDGVAAVQAVLREQPDVVVLDVQMPRITGYVACRLLKDDWQTKDIPVVLLTSLDAASDRYWGTQTGADRYLTKDFRTGELVAAVTDLVDRAARARGGRARLRPDPAEVTDSDVLAKVCDLLDRKLFEASAAAEVTALATTAQEVETTVTALLRLLRRFVDYELAGVLLHAEHTAYVVVESACSKPHHDDFLAAAVEALAARTRPRLPLARLDVRLHDPAALLGTLVEPDEGDEGDERSGDLATFLSMPLRGHGGQVVGVLALSSAARNAFGETALSTLHVIEGAMAVVIDNARMADRVSQT